MPLAEFCFRQQAPVESTTTSRLTLHWSSWVDQDSDDENDDGMPPIKPGREFSAFAKCIAGPATGNRRRVRLALWTAPACEDLDDTTSVGVCMDDKHEEEIVRGTPTAFKIRKFEVPKPNGQSGTRMICSPMVLFVEWSLTADCILYMPTTELPLARMRMLEHHTEIVGPAVAKIALEREPECLPTAPPERAVAVNPWQAAAAAAEKREERKRGRE